MLTESELSQLDELYKVISPDREDEKYEDQLNNAAEHIYSYLESRVCTFIDLL